MSRTHADPDCRDLALTPLMLDETAEVALEDYARVLTRARAAEVFREGEPPRAAGIHLCGVPEVPSPELLRDLQAFALDLVVRAEGGGLGWS